MYSRLRFSYSRGGVSRCLSQNDAGRAKMGLISQLQPICAARLLNGSFSRTRLDLTFHSIFGSEILVREIINSSYQVEAAKGKTEEPLYGRSQILPYLATSILSFTRS